MSRATEEIRRLVGPLDPMRAERPSTAPPVLDLIGRTTPEPARHPVRRRSVLAVAAAAMVIAGGVVVWNAAGPSAPRGYAATPPPLTFTPPTDPRPAKEILSDIAARAVSSSIPAGTPGGTDYLKLKAWYLNSQTDRSGTVSAVQASEQERWLHPDGSGRQVTRKYPPEFQSAADRDKWVAGDSGGDDVQEWGPGHFATDVMKDRPPPGMAALGAWLRASHPHQSDPIATIDAVRDLLNQWVLQPAERADLLRVIAALPGLTHDGATLDRAGRQGEAFSIDTNGHGLPARYTFVVDPANGLILDAEEMLTTSPGKLNVRVPAVISYVTYLQAEFLR